MKTTNISGRIRRCTAVLCLLLLVVMSVQPAEAKAFDKAAAKKKVSVTYRKVPEGVLVFLNNKNTVALELSMTMKFLDGDKTVLSKETQKNLCLTAKSKAVFLFQAPRDTHGNVISYTSYKSSFKVAKSALKSKAKKINVGSELDATMGRFTAINGSGKKLTSIRASVVFYGANDEILGCVTKYLNCFDKNAIDQFTISYADKTWRPSSAKVYIDWAY